MHWDQWKIQFENQNRLQIDMSDHIHVLAWGHPGRGTATQIHLQWNLSITTTQWELLARVNWYIQSSLKHFTE